MEEETHHVNCEPNILLVKNGDFISEGFEITPDQFSKTSGLVLTNQKNNIIQTLTIKSGLIYEGKKISSKIKGKKLSTKLKKLFFPGEQIFSTITISEPSVCEQINGKNGGQLLIRSIQLYEFPHIEKVNSIFKNQSLIEQKLQVNSNAHFVYKSNQKIQTNNPLNLVTEFLYIKINQYF